MDRPTRWPDLGRRAAVLVALVLTSACTSEAGDGDEAGAPPAEVSTGPPSDGPVAPEAPESSPPPPTDEPLPEVHHPLSLPALMQEAPDGGRPEILRTEYETAAYTRYDVTYRSDD